MSIAQEGGPPKVSLIYDPKVRSIAYQVVLCAIILFLGYSAVHNAAVNLEKAHIASGLGFWNQTAGFDISQTLIDYSAQAGSYGRAFWVGLLNTLLVSSLGIVLATALGFIIGIARLSRNWLVSRLAGGYVELIRNVTDGKTLVMVEHDMSVVFNLADRISVLVYGEVIASGTPQEIRGNKAVQEAYLGTEQH